MQLFVRSAGGRTVVLDATKDSTVRTTIHDKGSLNITSLYEELEFLSGGTLVG